MQQFSESTGFPEGSHRKVYVAQCGTPLELCSVRFQLYLYHKLESPAQFGSVKNCPRCEHTLDLAQSVRCSGPRLVIVCVSLLPTGAAFKSYGKKVQGNLIRKRIGEEKRYSKALSTQVYPQTDRQGRVVMSDERLKPESCSWQVARQCDCQCDYQCTFTLVVESCSDCDTRAVKMRSREAHKKSCVTSHAMTSHIRIRVWLCRAGDSSQCTESSSPTPSSVPQAHVC
ncbi:hypothetical protein F2P81_007781 [Scophthalmus maximus]|uniref:Uncharacterized protein n=1 Tax=Scophthalmus maximus TaxID=52904 RepID=A0A6A4SWB7_SCOMX|nr:hypothetical protein F2P81_007781 [Scophthalmus maximus]